MAIRSWRIDMEIQSRKAFQIGCTLVVIKTEAERRAEEAEERAKAAEAENRLLWQLVQGRAVA